MSSLLTYLVLLISFTIFYTTKLSYGAATGSSSTSSTTIKPLDTINKCGFVKFGGILQQNQLEKNDTTNLNSNLTENLSNKQASLGEFPWTVALYKENIVTCVGSLILPNIVLTAGHCVKDLNKENLKIKAGLWDLTTQTNEKYPVQERSISQIINHPEFSNENKSIKNDIALLVLEKPIELAEHIGLACLAPKDYKEKLTKCYAAGWGKEEKDGKSPNILKKLHLPYVTKDECEKKLKEKMPSLVLNDNTICAGGDKASTCIGDGGAGLVCQLKNHHLPSSTYDKYENSTIRYIQSGITSWGIGCTNELPGVYTNVSKYRDWIDEQIQKLGGDTKLYTATAA